MPKQSTTSITKQPNTTSESVNKGGKCIFFLNKDKCNGTLTGYTCGNKSLTCCKPKQSTISITKQPNTTSECVNKGGKYISFLNKDKCNGTLIGYTCGNKSLTCCKPKQSTTSTTKQPNISTSNNTSVDDTLCINKEGQCMNPNDCVSIGGTVKKNLCPGGANNRCCIMNVTPVGGGNTANNVNPVVNDNTTNNIPPVVNDNTANNAPPVSPVSGGNTDLGKAIVDYALQFDGNPYYLGGNSLTNGIDCSGFTQQIFANFNINLKRTSKAQSQEGTLIDGISNAQVADLFFYCDNNADLSTVHHVAIYQGPDVKRIIHARNSRKGILQDPETYDNGPCIIRRYI